jgi:SAM-dependent methyltransferase
VNVGAGTGNYEPTGRELLVAVEPARAMLDQRAPRAAPAVQAVAESLPFPASTFDVALAVLTVHHWRSLARGLAELRRVARRQVLYVFDTTMTDAFWLVTDYFPEILDLRSERAAPSLAALTEHLDVRRVETVPVPSDCTDGFGGCYWNRPEAYLDPVVRAGMSSFAQLDRAVEARGVERLRSALESGAWDARHGALRTKREHDLGYRIVIAGGADPTGE